MYVTISLYPTIAKMTGLSIIYEHTYSEDPIVEGTFYKKVIKDILNQHWYTIDEDTDEIDSIGSDDDDINEYERYTLIVTYRESFPLYARQPIIIHHGKPTQFRCSEVYENMTKKEIWSKTLTYVEDMFRQAAHLTDDEDDDNNDDQCVNQI